MRRQLLCLLLFLAAPSLLGGLLAQNAPSARRTLSEPAAKVLRELGSEKVWVVHGDGFDEMTITGQTQMAVLADGKVLPKEVMPSDFGFGIQSADAIAGGDAAYNARALTDLLDGFPSAYRDMVLMNAASSLVIADKAGDIMEGVRLAAASIDEGKAKAALDQLVISSNRGKA